MPKILSPPTEPNLPKAQKTSAATLKRRRMANVLDVVLESTKALSPAPAKKIVQSKAKSQTEAGTEQAEAEATQSQAEAEAGPSVPVAAKPVAFEDRSAGHIAPETPAPEAPIETINYIFQHALGKNLFEDEITEARHYAQRLKYTKGALVFNESN